VTAIASDPLLAQIERETAARLAEMRSKADAIEARLDAAAAASVRPWRTLRTILADPEALAPPAVVVPRLAWRGRVTLLAAREKDGKSTIATAGAAAVTSGRAFLDGSPTSPAPVLWVAVEEHPHDLAQRCDVFGADPDRFVVLGITDTPLDTLRAAVADVRPALVVLDTLATWADRFVEDAHSSAAWTPVMAALTAVARDSDAGVLVLHHARKSDGAYRDSSAIGAGVDALLEMFPDAQDPAARTLKARARWQVQGFAVRFTGDAFTLNGGQLSLDAMILSHVGREPGLSLKGLRDAVGGRAAALDRAVSTLLGRGAMRDLGNGNGHRYYLPEDVPDLVPVDESGQGSGQPPLSRVSDCGTTPGQGSGQGGCPDSKPLGTERDNPPGRGDAWEPEP
jgi:hypothetical protein